jgi:hypothetical protein
VRVAESRSFVFIDIPAPFLQFLNLLLLSFPVGGDIMSQTAERGKRRADANSSQTQ